MSCAPCPISLLYVEDDMTTGNILSRILSSTFSQLRIHTAGSGEDGIRMFRQHRHDIVVSDIMMPGLDGLQMAKEILLLGPETMCIFTTAKTADPEFMDQLKRLRHARLYHKPTDCFELINGIRECVDTIKANRKGKFAASMRPDTIVKKSYPRRRS